MTAKEIKRRNGIAYCLLGLAFSGLGINDLRIGDSGPGAMFLLAGVAFFMEILLVRVPKKRESEDSFPPGHGNRKNGKNS